MLPDFPGGPMDRIHLPMQGHVFDPWSGEEFHALGQLCPCATTTEAHAPRAYARKLECSRSLQLESPCMSVKTQRNQINK